MFPKKVTPVQNVETDAEGNFLLDEYGLFVLKNEDDIGTVGFEKEASVPVDDGNGGVVMADVIKFSVSWDLRPYPAAVSEYANNVVFMGLDYGDASDMDDEGPDAG